MKRIKVLVIDKDVLTRQAISRMLSPDEFKVAGVANDVSQAKKLIERLTPDVLLIDINYLDSDVSPFFSELRSAFQDLPVVLLANKTEEGARKVISALEMGAVDFITKPSPCTNLLFAVRHLAKRVPSIVRAAAQTQKMQSKNMIPDRQAYFEDELSGINTIERAADVIVIGGCTGGPHALFSMIPALPANLPVPIVVAQHLPRYYTKVLAERLDERSDIRVREAYDRAELKAGTVWLAPGGFHTEIGRRGQQIRLTIHRAGREHGNRPGIDTLFRSAAKIYGPRVLGIMLSGHGDDGAQGSQIIQIIGGQIIVQDPTQALVPDLPLKIMQMGIANRYYSVEEIPDQIMRRISYERSYTRMPGNPVQQYGYHDFKFS